VPGRPSGTVQERTVSRVNQQLWWLKFSIGRADNLFTMNNEVSASTMFQPNGTPSTEGEIMTVMDVARFLRVPKSTVYKLARVGGLPASPRPDNARRHIGRDTVPGYESVSAHAQSSLTNICHKGARLRVWAEARRL